MLKFLYCRHTLSYSYRIRKPRVFSQNTVSLINYRKSLSNARRSVIFEANQYQQRIQDAYLQQHRQDTSQRHFQNECDFRKYVVKNAYTLKQNTKKWEKTDQFSESRLDAFVKRQDVKRANRERIKKILEFESSNYWFDEANLQQRLTGDMLFPEFLGSTEYYHKLHIEALAYEVHDFDMLERTHSNEEAIRQKNRVMIPLYKELLQLVRLVKKNPVQDLQFQYQVKYTRIKKQMEGRPDSEIQQTLSKLEQTQNVKLEKLKQQLGQQSKRKQILKSKLRHMIGLLKTWQNYTTVLGMSATQVNSRLEEIRQTPKLKKSQKKILKEYSEKSQSSFLDLQQQDTEDQQISFEMYVEEIRKDQSSVRDGMGIGKTREQEELQALMGTNKEVEELARNIEQNQQKNKQTPKSLTSLGIFTELEFNQDLDYKIEPHMKFEKQTTATVQVMKELYGNDQELKSLLNQVGEAKLQYPKLFRKIWSVV